MNKFDFSVIGTLRNKLGISAEELAQKANVTRATINKMEKGEGNPTMGTIEALASVFKLAPCELVHLAEKTRMEMAKTKGLQMRGLTGKRILFPDFEALHIKAKAGIHKDFDPIWHENSTKICIVLSGSLRLSIGEATNLLEAGKALRFKASHDHQLDIMDDAEFLLIQHNPV